MNKAASVNPPKASTSNNPPGGTGRRRLLVGLLILTALLYVITLPWQRRMAAETERIDRENAAKRLVLARQNEAESSLKSGLDAVERNPGDVRAQIQLAQRYAEAGRLDEAEARAEIAVGLQANNLEPLLVLADIEQRARHYDAAVRAYKRALMVSSSDARARVGLAYLYVLFGWPLETEALLKPAIAANPENPHLKVAIALAYVQHGDYISAEKQLLEARRLAPDDVALWSPLVHVYNETKRYDRAVEVARAALARMPDAAPILSEMGKSFYYRNDYAQAESTFRKAISVQPEDLTAHYYLALTYQRSDRIPSAVTELEYVLKRNPDFEQTRQVLGKLYLRTGRTAEAGPLLKEADILQAQGQKHQRAGILVSTKPNDPQAHWQMAAVYREEHNDSRALVEARKALELNPNHKDAQELLAKLQAAGTR